MDQLAGKQGLDQLAGKQGLDQLSHLDYGRCVVLGGRDEVERGPILELRLLDVEDEGCEGQLEGPAERYVVSIKIRIRVSSLHCKK